MSRETIEVTRLLLTSAGFGILATVMAAMYASLLSTHSRSPFGIWLRRFVAHIAVILALGSLLYGINGFALAGAGVSDTNTDIRNVLGLILVAVIIPATYVAIQCLVHLAIILKQGSRIDGEVQEQ